MRKNYLILFYFTLPVVIFAQETYPHSECEVIYDENGVALPFIIQTNNAGFYGFENIEIENPFLQSSRSNVGDSHVIKEITGLDNTIIQKSSITETIVNQTSGKMIQKATYDHYTYSSTVDYLPFEEEYTQLNSGIFNTEDFSPEGFSGTLNVRGVEQINELYTEEFISANSQWSVGFDANGMMDLSEDGIEVSVPADLGLDMDISYLGCNPISTDWGIKNAALIHATITGNISMGSFTVDMSNNSDFPSNQDPIIKFHGFAMDIDISMNAYLLKDFGEHMINMKGTFSFPSDLTFEYQGEYHSFSIPQSFPIFFSQRSYSDRNYASSPLDFTEKIENVSPFADILGSWTWNGAFPWVYDHSSKNWYYYYHSNGGYYVYHPISNDWFVFDNSSRKWAQTSK